MIPLLHNHLRRATLCLALIPAIATAAPNVTGTKDDNAAPGVRKLPGDNITYTITIGNTGPDAATGVFFTDPDPANTTFVSIQSTAEFRLRVID